MYSVSVRETDEIALEKVLCWCNRKSYPGLAEQTILLCTTSEIRKDKDYMKLEPFLSRSYTLVRDVESQSTHVEEGYFGVMCNE